MTHGPLPGMDKLLDVDSARDEVLEALGAADPRGQRTAGVFRHTFDQLYDGQHTGRFRWAQLYKTEKTHFGTLLEINLRREFAGVIEDGRRLDYSIAGHDIDCKYSQSGGGWMLPPECFGELLLVATADDSQNRWSLGVVRATNANRRPGANRDAKTGLNVRGRSQIAWFREDHSLPPNVLLSLDEPTLARIFRSNHGQQRILELFRLVTERRIGRNTIATVAQQDDYMARVRDNGHGARTVLRDEGIIIPGGDYTAHRDVAIALGVEPPSPGEVVSIRVTPASPSDPWTVELDGGWWRRARQDEMTVSAAPKLPRVARAL